MDHRAAKIVHDSPTIVAVYGYISPERGYEAKAGHRDNETSRIALCEKEIRRRCRCHQRRVGTEIMIPIKTIVWVNGVTVRVRVPVSINPKVVVYGMI